MRGGGGSGRTKGRQRHAPCPHADLSRSLLGILAGSLMKDGTETETGAVEKPPFLTPDSGDGVFSIIFSRKVDCDVS